MPAKEVFSRLAEVKIQEGESIESALRRFKRKVQQEDIIKDIKKHSFYLKPGDRRRAKQALALSPTTAEAWIVLGAALDALGERVAARDAYQKCAALPLDGDGARYVGECKRLLR